jgi:uncharacterized protein YceH (UPF0502 family)
MLDATEQRVIGVLLEKERTVPDTYPLSENALLAGCNQSNNRDPQMSLEVFQLHGVLLSLQEKGWIARVDGGSRVTKFRHKVVERLGLTDAQLAVLAELLLRGAQAPGALKPRVARMGFVGSAEDVLRTLQELAARPEPIVEQLPLASRERDRRWQHRLGERASGSKPSLVGAAGGGDPAAVGTPAQPAAEASVSSAGTPQGSAARVAVDRSAAGSVGADLAGRVEALEAVVEQLRRDVTELRGLLQ